MTLGQIISQIKRLIGGGNLEDDFPWDDREIAAAVGQSRDARVRISMFENGQLTDLGYAMFPEILKAYYPLVPVCDTVRNRWYVDLPKPFTGGLPENKGLFQLGPMKSEADAYIQVQPNFAATSSGLDVAAEIGTYFWPEGQNRLWLGNWKKDGPKELMAKIVPSPAGLDMDDELPMPDHLLQGVVDDVVKRYLSVPEGAEINDSRGAR